MVSRRDWLRMAAAGVSFCSVSGWIGSLAAATQRHPDRKRSCILLWMPGGPSQLDTFDPKPGHANGGPFKAIATSAPGVMISEHLPKLAKQMGQAAVIRSMYTKEGDHNRATSLMRTGYLPQGPIRYPYFGSLFSKELVDPHSEMPAFVSIAPAGFSARDPASWGLNMRRWSSAAARSLRPNPERPMRTHPKKLHPTNLVRRSRSPTWGGRRASPRRRPRPGSTSSSSSTSNFLGPTGPADCQPLVGLRTGRAADAGQGERGVRPRRGTAESSA